MNPQNSNPNDYKVVKFTNKTDFDFTSEMGCMYDGRPIFGIKGALGIASNESIVLPYHVGQLIAQNLAKVAMNRQAPATDVAGIPTGVPLWNLETLETRKQSYLEELYSEQKPMAMTETDKLMAKVEELRKFVGIDKEKVVDEEKTEAVVTTDTPKVYQDKQEVISALTEKGIKFDARKSKAELELLLA